ncbi:hypothetical protein THOM_0530 [Trachipleistophora hominis]|uniref:Transposable element encoded protein n=1 Tax=Trachipleistophora hominis TaxID=72359 RepID=L7K080_TRAHO|nr:hypothetical protein THOM_0530 [Trachipleistophora hominis]
MLSLTVISRVILLAINVHSISAYTNMVEPIITAMYEFVVTDFLLAKGIACIDDCAIAEQDAYEDIAINTMVPSAVIKYLCSLRSIGI